MIEVENIKKTYPDGTRALNGVSFHIAEGEFVAIVGPSGSGKSTLLHILGFLDRQSAGIYSFDGKTWDDYSPELLAGVRNTSMGFVFQAFNLLPRATVFENVKLPLMYSSIPASHWDERIRRALDAVGLSHRMRHESSRLSGGEKQRTAIARALVTEPKVIFADEPTGNLDSKSGETIMDILQELNKQGKTIILITHETYTVKHAMRVIHIHDGVVESDEKILQRRAAEYH